MKIESGVGAIDASQSVKSNVQNPVLPAGDINRPSNTIRRPTPNSILQPQGVVVPPVSEGAKNDTGTLPVERSPEAPLTPESTPAPAAVIAPTNNAPSTVQKNDLGSSGMSDAVLYSPATK